MVIPLFSASVITATRYTYISIVGNVLITSLGNFSLGGKPGLVDGWKGGLALRFDGQSYIENGDQNSCLQKPELCLNLGFSFKFSLRISAMIDNSYIFSSGGDLLDSRGVSLYIRKGRMYLTLSTQDFEWTVVTVFRRVGVYFDFEFSWGLNYGLECFMDGVSVGRARAPIKRTIKGTKSYGFRIGGPIPGGKRVASKCEVGSTTLVKAETRIVTAVGFVIGKAESLVCHVFYFFGKLPFMRILLLGNLKFQVAFGRYFDTVKKKRKKMRK